MDALALRDIRWIFLAFLFFSGFSGLWRTYTRLKDAIAFGKLAPTFEGLCFTIQVYRLGSFTAVLGSGLAYWLAYPLNPILWWMVGIWIFYGINLIGRGQRILEQIIKK